jgi:hypothetical protein
MSERGFRLAVSFSNRQDAKYVNYERIARKGGRAEGFNIIKIDTSALLLFLFNKN